MAGAVLSHAHAPSQHFGKETFEAIVWERGKKFARHVSGDVRSLIDWADRNHPGSKDCTIRGEFTSDGTKWPGHGGRVMCSRTSGRWLYT